MNQTVKIAAAAILGLSALTAGAPAATAAVVCNAEGACWHVRHPYAYRPEYGLVVHPDHWRWGDHDHYEWREHRGRGYWSHGVWVHF
jgi:hypothetical protein